MAIKLVTRRRRVIAVKRGVISVMEGRRLRRPGARSRGPGRGLRAPGRVRNGRGTSCACAGDVRYAVAEIAMDRGAAGSQAAFRTAAGESGPTAPGELIVAPLAPEHRHRYRNSINLYAGYSGMTGNTCLSAVQKQIVCAIAAGCRHPSEGMPSQRYLVYLKTSCLVRGPKSSRTCVKCPMLADLSITVTLAAQPSSRAPTSQLIN
ncbi:unnamed protein product [Danaus chrysippus]|uniref:(African queen) hypothetical protein n=1 Tax=Danaus chrysippus TaxID=151541 RepID=A0A8J2QX57_9NEOP|nr:unnamed protein product [Danaus chrysippus]